MIASFHNTFSGGKRRDVEAATWAIVAPPTEQSPAVGTAGWALRELEAGREVIAKGLAYGDNWWKPSYADFFRREISLYRDLKWLNREMWAAMQGKQITGDAGSASAAEDCSASSETNGPRLFGRPGSSEATLGNSPQLGGRHCSECNCSLSDPNVPPVLKRRGVCSIACKYKADDRVNPRCLVCLTLCDNKLCATHHAAWTESYREDFAGWVKDTRWTEIEVPRCRAAKEGA
jgi:hypothetical protein